MLELVWGWGLPWPLALAPSLSLQAGWLLQPLPSPLQRPTQVMFGPTGLWKEAAYQRGKDTLFRPGHLPGLGAPCSGLAGKARHSL